MCGNINMLVETLVPWQTHWCIGADTGALAETMVETLMDWWRHWETLLYWWRHCCTGGDTGGLVETLVETLDYGGDAVAIMGPLHAPAAIAQSNLT